MEYHLENNKIKKAVCFQCRLIALLIGIFDPQLVETLDVEPTETEV